jgi:outer membrane protein, multidrug efflux system
MNTDEHGFKGHRPAEPDSRPAHHLVTLGQEEKNWCFHHSYLRLPVLLCAKVFASCEEILSLQRSRRFFQLLGFVRISDFRFLSAFGLRVSDFRLGRPAYIRGSIELLRLKPALPCLCLLCILWAGCAVGPNYKRPPVDAPQTFRPETAASTNSFADLPWWEIFHDANLQILIRTALTNNYDLRIALTRVEQARELAAQARAGFFPQVNYLGLAGKGKNVAAGGAPSPSGVTGGLVAADVNASWEIDLWGRIRRLNESARAQFFASQEARRDTTISIIAEIAQNYFQLLALDRELQIAKDNTNAFGGSFKIFNERLQGGVASKLETSSAQALLNSAAATIPNLERQIAMQENVISVLTGRRPGPISRENSSIEEQSLPEIPAGLPSSLLERRPDIREAEQQLRSANAQVGVAAADFFPQLNLTGLFGRVSPGLSAFTGGGTTAWSAGASLTGPIFHGGELRSRYRQAKASRDQFALQYQAAVLNALQEVSSALISREKFAEAQVEQAHAVDAYKEAVKISLERYRQGNASYYEVLQEQQLLFPAENAVVETELNQFLSVIQLYRALGGGWSESQQ